jgi:hypothetical protein
MSRYISSYLYVLLATSILASASAPLRAQAAPLTPEERIERLERLLAETRAELAALKASSTAATDARLAEIERKLDILTQEIEALKVGEAAPAPMPKPPEPAAPIADLRRGLGLSASKVYAVKSGVSIGGYGEALYQNFASKDQSGAPSLDEDQVTFLRAVVYLGYKFDDHFVLNTELEYENAVVASDKGGEASVEFAYIDYMRSRALNARAGLVLIPMGLINELHEPTSFLGARRPDVEDVIIPSTWRELGFGLYGEAGPIAYRAYMVNGLNAAGYSADEGIREGRQEGSEARAKDWAFTGRLDYTGIPGLLVGASVFTGDAGQGRVTPSGREIDALTTVVDVHADWQWRGLWLRGLYAHSSVGQADLVNEANGFTGDASVGSRQEGWYLQGAYDLLSLRPGSRASLLPYARYEQYDTQASVPAGFERNPENDVRQLTLGLAFKPIDRLILKADWQRRRNAARTGVDRWNVALGYIF